MTKPTTEELQAEFEKVVKTHNQAQDVVEKCKKRFIEINAILKDRLEEE
tara:strand:+ start:4470 stop:4616 length:147 start_codon:yes stop_codon:yes gene_type:complete